MRAALDTNVLLRALVTPKGAVAPVLAYLAAGAFTLIYTQALFAEFLEVIDRPRIWGRYLRGRREDVNEVINRIRTQGLLVVPERRITICRDPKDNMVLEAAIAGRADVIVSADHDLLVLHPFEGIPILGPSRFLALLTEQAPGESRGA